MSVKELDFVKSHSAATQEVDPAPIIRASRQNADMLSLSRDDFESHPLGYFVTESSGSGSEAVGYVACQRLLPSAARGGELALIGSLYLDPKYRGLRLGPEGERLSTTMIRLITAEAFASFDDVMACVAQCGGLATSAFRGAGYQPSTQAETAAGQKIEHTMTREQWQAAAGAQG